MATTQRQLKREWRHIEGALRGDGDEMNELLSEARTIILGLFSALVGVLIWISKRLHARVDHIEANFVSKPDFEKLLKQLNDDRREKHEQNVTTLARIEQKIDINEARSSKSRHDIRNSVNSLVTKVAVINTRLDIEAQSDDESERSDDDT